MGGEAARGVGAITGPAVMAAPLVAPARREAHDWASRFAAASTAAAAPAVPLVASAAPAPAHPLAMLSAALLRGEPVLTPQDYAALYDALIAAAPARRLAPATGDARRPADAAAAGVVRAERHAPAEPVSPEIPNPVLAGLGLL